jgi:UDP-N-acetylglucosamine acyltransferase
VDPAPLSADIHPTAIVAATSVIDPEAMIGAYSVLYDDVTIGPDSWVGSHVVLATPPGHRAQHPGGRPTPNLGVEVGARCVIHEFTSIQGGVFRKTEIGDDCFLMAKADIGHDCVLEDRVTVAIGASIGGESTIRRAANIGLGATVHQGTDIGEYSMIGMGAVVVRDVPPFATVLGGVGRVVGANAVGIERAGLSGDWVDSYRDFVDGADPAGLPEIVESAFRRWQGMSLRGQHD